MNISKIERGFTLIELLVVIAIIGVLSSIVLSSLNTARNKGTDASVKSNLDSSRAQAELFYDANGNKYVQTAGTATDVCNVAGSVGSPAVKGIYAQVLAAAQSAGLGTVNNVIGTTGGLLIATCHTCNAATGGSDCNSKFDRWAAEAPLKSSGGTLVYCVDSSGTATSTPTNLGPGDTTCS
jgi:prepilin-type N-terminal cleavage/methylation domain-containing protein